MVNKVRIKKNERKKEDESQGVKKREGRKERDRGEKTPNLSPSSASCMGMYLFKLLLSSTLVSLLAEGSVE